MYQGLRVAVVIPAYEEALRVGATVRAIPAFVDSVIVVDDASHDGTAAAASATNEVRVTVLRHEANRGVGAAIATGYRHARCVAHADAIVVMAGDGQMSPDDLPALLSPIAAGEADYVKGNRLRHARVSDMPVLRRMGTAALGWLTGHAVGVAGLGDSQCGYTALAGTLLDRLPLERMYPRYGYPNDLLSWVTRAGGRVCEVPVRPVYAGEASGLRPWHALVMLGLIARARLRRGRPIIVWLDQDAYGVRDAPSTSNASRTRAM